LGTTWLQPAQRVCCFCLVSTLSIVIEDSKPVGVTDCEFGARGKSTSGRTPAHDGAVASDELANDAVGGWHYWVAQRCRF